MNISETVGGFSNITFTFLGTFQNNMLVYYCDISRGELNVTSSVFQ